MTGQRRRQVVTQRHPLLVVILKREHAFVRPVAVGQEFAERIGVFEQRRFDRIETIMLVNRPDLGGHLVDGANVAGRTIDKATRQAGLELLRFLLFVAHILGNPVREQSRLTSGLG
ncbi:hypothetical protein RHSP_10272 [Rhizobium freirei PRF 81]|uniref:Uncharacterized protein n=1 Tax=Rhizobium freirei PRF 81 TaxID=363754 RepID=N6VD09_9HYPH|nr:hypothetical protein RHSP_10272 [Rhizobium freirei PRF 81]